MKHPALARMLGVFLAVISLVSLVAGALGFVRAGTDDEEKQRELSVLEKRIARAEETDAELAALRPEYEKVMLGYPERMAAHKDESDAYRMKLAEFTATRAGLSMGRRQLDETSETLDESMEMFLTGFFMFKRGEDAFQPIYDVYLVLRGTLDQEHGIYDEALASLPEGAEGEPSLTPEQILALAQLGHEGYAQLEDLLGGLRDQTPSDQRQAAELIKKALEEYNEVGPQMQDFSVDRLAYGVTVEVYERAEEAIERMTALGMSEEEARAAADEICRESFGLSFEELGALIAESEPEGGEGTGVSIPPETAEQLLEEIPDDRALIEGLIGLIGEEDAALSEKEAAFRADPRDMGAAELLITGIGEGLDASERLMGLVEPTIVETKRMLDSTHEQLDAAWYAIHTAQEQVKEGYAALEEKEKELVGTKKELLDARRELKIEQRALGRLTETVESYETQEERSRSLRAELRGDDEIYAREQRGTPLFSAARLALVLRRTEAVRELRLRRVCAVLAALSGAVGFLSALAAFEKPRMKKPWLPLSAAILGTAACEAISLALGRGLWYSALFVGVFALLLLPLAVGKQKGDA